jgi:hypothetical protein
VAIFPKFSGEHRFWGFTDFNDLASEEPRLVTRQVEEVLQGLREKSQAGNTRNRIGGGLRTNGELRFTLILYGLRLTARKARLSPMKLGSATRNGVAVN